MCMMLPWSSNIWALALVLRNLFILINFFWIADNILINIEFILFFFSNNKQKFNVAKKNTF